ncbi:hypothetical protein HGM15179_019418 [Zosterops borbonicus]|uniref:RNase H type-1 domain-containing protein n=1 Tax=Zosterops borbonicus TaxID=364589 RepID=A0A8K1FYN6_9PASS|nr:hypothetical protein HGM15179_019418 [Zosterops borbonicus]
MLRIKTLHGVMQRVLKEEEEGKSSKATVSVSTQTVTEEKGTKSKATVFSSSQTITEGKEAKSEATVSTSMQTVTEKKRKEKKRKEKKRKEKRNKGAISISTQTVIELEQPKPVAVATTQKKKSRSKSVRIVTDEDAAGLLQPAEETEIEIITRSLSLDELCDLRKEFACQTNESILTWLLRIWDTAANDTILDGIEARQLGSLSRDVVIDQGIRKTQEPLSLWQRLLTSVKDRYLCKEDLQVHQGKWRTMEQGIQCLRELAVLEIIFSEDERFPKSPDGVQCTSQMWLRFARLGPEMYSRYLATLQWREGEDRVGVLANKLRIYEDTVTAPVRTHVSSVETRLAEQVQNLIEEGHQKLKKELKEEIYHISPDPRRVSAIRSRCLPARERGYKPRGNLWSLLQEHGEDMKWDGKITSSLAAWCTYIGNPNRPGFLEVITNWPEGVTFGLLSEEEEKQVTRAKEAPPYNELPETERRYALFTDGSCRIVGTNWKWKAAVWSPTREVAQATEGQGGSSHVAELKAVQLALDIAEREKWPRLYLYTDSWMGAVLQGQSASDWKQGPSLSTMSSTGSYPPPGIHLFQHEHLLHGLQVDVCILSRPMGCRGTTCFTMSSAIRGDPQDNWPPELVHRDGEQNRFPVIQEEAVRDLMSHLDAHKSMGPDRIHPRVMRELAEELDKLVSINYHQSWLAREVPDDWNLANVTPIHKKGQKEDPRNYRPVTQTLVPGKLTSYGMEYPFG